MDCKERWNRATSQTHTAGAPGNKLEKNDNVSNTKVLTSQTQISKKSVVFEHVFAQLLQLRLILEMEIALQETLVQLYDMAKREMLPWCLVQPPRGLNELSPTKCISVTANIHTMRTDAVPSMFHSLARGW